MDSVAQALGMLQKEERELAARLGRVRAAISALGGVDQSESPGRNSTTNASPNEADEYGRLKAAVAFAVDTRNEGDFSTADIRKDLAQYMGNQLQDIDSSLISKFVRRYASSRSDVALIASGQGKRPAIYRKLTKGQSTGL
jgi:hypothetical protein